MRFSSVEAIPKILNSGRVSETMDISELQSNSAHTLMLVSALMGRERMQAAYAHSIAGGYRFYILWRAQPAAVMTGACRQAQTTRVKPTVFIRHMP